VSTAGVILVEYLALSRLTVAVTAWPLRRVLAGIGVVMVATAPVLLINRDQIYDDLLTPSVCYLRRLPALRRPAGRPPAAGSGARGRRQRAGRLRAVDGDPDGVLLIRSSHQGALCGFGEVVTEADKEGVGGDGGGGPREQAPQGVRPAPVGERFQGLSMPSALALR